MQSISKITLSHDQIQSLVSHHFGSATRVKATEELTEGYFATAYRLDLADGRTWVMKVSPPPHVRVLRYERDIMSAEVATMRLLRERTSLPVAEIHCYDASRTLLDNEFFIMEYLPGAPLHKVRGELAPDVQQRINRQIGAYLREINAIEGAAFGYGPESAPRFATWREAFDAMLMTVLQDGEDMGVELPLSYAGYHDLARQHYTTLDEVRTPRLVHWDLWDGNIFFDMATQRITGIIDHERALWGDPLMEVNFTGYDPDSDFAIGYGTPVLDTPAQRTRRALYSLYLFLIMVIECYYRKYPTNGQELWAREQLAKTVDALNNGAHPGIKMHSVP
ncbi:MAG TPA: aminoglycoside phosphotransferase family protein [Anaerolineae bacterium]|nr:aminoglycoside phosphotransferase family protein [Anaerolineae bacterium]HQK14913.1 aminoglycoside phosphotransferase family protein [Anaerolineae bacterium]